MVYIGEKRELSTTCVEKVGKFINRIDIVGKSKILEKEIAPAKFHLQFNYSGYPQTKTTSIACGRRL